jgi:hypothetical protein
LTAVAKTIKEFSKYKMGESTDISFWNLFCNFETVSKKHKKENSFIIELYTRKITVVNAALFAILEGQSFDIDTDVFRRHSDIFFTEPVSEAEDYFYAVVVCGESVDWFISPEGEIYLDQINKTIKAEENIQTSNDTAKKKRKIKRIFVCKNIASITSHDWICIQLHKNSDYQFKILTNNDVYQVKGKNGAKIQRTLAIYRKNFMWEKTSKIADADGEMSVDPQKIKDYTDLFEKIWAKPEGVYNIPKPFDQIKGHITELTTIIRKHEKTSEIKVKPKIAKAKSNASSKTQTAPKSTK